MRSHLAVFPATTRPEHGALVFTTTGGEPIRRNRFGDVWRAAVRRSGARPYLAFHDLRHYYASLLIRHGGSVKVVQRRLGHKTAKETLDAYGHLWPDSDERTRDAVDAELFPSTSRRWPGHPDCTGRRPVVAALTEIFRGLTAAWRTQPRIKPQVTTVIDGEPACRRGSLRHVL